MASSLFLLAIFLLSSSPFISLSAAKFDLIPANWTGNVMDDCWLVDSNWEQNRKQLANCAVGYGRDAIGGRDGKFYVVSDSSDDDVTNPKPGTLRHGALLDEPVWIIFNHDMVIKLKQDLIMRSFKTIDGRGANVSIAGGACINLIWSTNVIIHGIHIHDCKPAGNAEVAVASNPQHVSWISETEGDGISMKFATDVWVDHCTLSNSHGWLISAIGNSQRITISNSYFSHNNKVMLLGRHYYPGIKEGMGFTIIMNRFGEGLGYGMPRCKNGIFHIMNNDYTHWDQYAIGGSDGSVIVSSSNIYAAPNNASAKEVAKRLGDNEEEWKHWTWISSGDLMLNGAFFRSTGTLSRMTIPVRYPKPVKFVKEITRKAGALSCKKGSVCT